MLQPLRVIHRSLEYCRSLERLFIKSKSSFAPRRRTGLSQVVAGTPLQETERFEDGYEFIPGNEISTEIPQELKTKPWGRGSRRTGLVAIKLGMTQMWDKNGYPMATTVLQVVDNEVVMVRKKQRKGFFGIQVGAVNRLKIRNVRKAILGQYDRAGVQPKKKLMEFRTTFDAVLPVGTQLLASHFVPGQFVDVTAISMGKGFQGVMKKHNMKGQPASHGVTKTHRKMGATGGGQDPGRVWPGKRMPGHMGAKRVTTFCHQVLRVNSKYNVIYVKGPVPGPKNANVGISDARFKKAFTEAPFPTFIPEPNSDQPEEVYADSVHVPHESSIVFEDKRKEVKDPKKKK